MGRSHTNRFHELRGRFRGSTTTNEAMQYDTSNRLTKWCQAASCTGATKWISYAYDPVGSRSQQVALFLENQGFKNLYNLQGGVDAWAREVDPQMNKY